MLVIVDYMQTNYEEQHYLTRPTSIHDDRVNSRFEYYVCDVLLTLQSKTEEEYEIERTGIRKSIYRSYIRLWLSSATQPTNITLVLLALCCK
jgi:hypothetical protein